MKQVINLLLDIGEDIMIIKEKSDSYNKIKPHLTLVYPFEVSNQEKLKEHINNSIKEIKPFKLVLNGLQKSAKEYYLYLLVDEGKKEIIKLYKNLNSGILSEFKNKDMPTYIPHLTLDVFKTEEEINKAIKDIEEKDLRFEVIVKSIQLLTLNNDLTINKKEDFKLR